MIGDFARAVAQLFDPRFLGVLVKSVALTFALLVGLIVLFFQLLGLIPEISFTIPLIDYPVTFLDEAARAASFGLILLLSAFMMFPVTAIFIGFFLDEIADAVEARHYPHLPAPRRQSLGEMIGQSAAFLGAMIAANAVALIFYLMATVLAPLVFWIVNGYLLGREYFELVAARRVGRDEARALRKRRLFPIWIAGALVAIPLSFPVINLVAPVIGVAAFVHLYHRKIGRAAGAARP